MSKEPQEVFIQLCLNFYSGIYRKYMLKNQSVRKVVTCVETFSGSEGSSPIMIPGDIMRPQWGMEF